MIDMIWHVCAVPLDLPGTGREPGQWCPNCQHIMMPSMPDNDLVLPDVVTSNTPPPVPLHDVYFFPPYEPCPAHALTRTQTQDPHTCATPTTPRSYIQLPQLCWDTRPPRKKRDRGAQGEAEDTSLVWTQVGEELRQAADTFQLGYVTTSENQQQPAVTVTKAIATGLCLTLLCLASCELLTKFP